MMKKKCVLHLIHWTLFESCFLHLENELSFSQEERTRARTRSWHSLEIIFDETGADLVVVREIRVLVILIRGIERLRFFVE